MLSYRDGYTTQEAAQYLGISLKEMRSALRNRTITYYRPSPKKTLYFKEDLDDYRANWRCVPAIHPT